MCDIMNEAFKEVVDKRNREIALDMIMQGEYSDEQITRLSKLSEKDIHSLRASLKRND